MSISQRLLGFLATVTAPLRRHWRAVFAVGVAGLVFLQIFAFSPSRLEQDQPPEPVHEQELAPTTPQFETQIPKDRVPAYTIDGFQYVSAQGVRKQWKINASQAYFYTKEGYVISTQVTVQLYDREGKITNVTARESKYRLDKQDLELFGDVVTVFPDGMRMETPYLLYEADARDLKVPSKFPVHGITLPSTQGEVVEFFSQGLLYDAKAGLLRLPQSVRTVATRKVRDQADERTTIVSDLAEMTRADRRITYSMAERRPIAERFVLVDQPGMKSRSRRVEFLSHTGKKGFKHIRAIDDVRIDETPKVNAEDASNPRLRQQPVPRRATAGLAEFIPDEQLIVLRQFPQVYQGADTVTGEVILIHRDTDLVEVEQSNAYSEGELKK